MRTRVSRRRFEIEALERRDTPSSVATNGIIVEGGKVERTIIVEGGKIERAIIVEGGKVERAIIVEGGKAP